MTLPADRCPTYGWTGHRADYPTPAGRVLCRCGVTYGPPADDRDGATYNPRLDRVPLNAQAQRVWDAIKSGRWLTLAELAADTGDPEASVSARLRDLRKPRFGSHVIRRRRRPDLEGGRLFEYRLEVPAAAVVTPTLPGLE